MCSPNVKAIATAEKTKKACELGMRCIAYVGGQVLANTGLIQKLGLECREGNTYPGVYSRKYSIHVYRIALIFRGSKIS